MDMWLRFDNVRWIRIRPRSHFVYISGCVITCACDRPPQLTATPRPHRLTSQPPTRKRGRSSGLVTMWLRGSTIRSSHNNRGWVCVKQRYEELSVKPGNFVATLRVWLCKGSRTGLRWITNNNRRLTCLRQIYEGVNVNQETSWLFTLGLIIQNDRLLVWGVS